MKRRCLLIGLIVLFLLAIGPYSKVATAVEESEIEQAINDGLLWLVGQQNVNGSWGTSYQIAETAFAVLKLETYAVETGQLIDGKIEEIMIGGTDYYPDVQEGLAYLFDQAYAMDLTDPDGNADGKAVYFTLGGDTYETSIALMAIAASTHPELVTSIDGISMTYEDVVQNLVDFLVYGQNDGAAVGDNRGGWGYDDNSGWSDQSNTGYAVLGLAYAQAPSPHGFGIEIPQITKDELDYWITWAQCENGGSKYYPGYSGCYWVNTLKTGNLLFEMAFVGDTTDTPRVINALSYISDHWYDTDLIEGWGWNDPTGPLVAQYQAAYCLMKGLEAMNVEMDGIPGVADWFQDLADVIVPQQTIAGNWPSSAAFVWPNGSTYMADVILSTLWALLALEKAAPPVGEIPVYVDIKPGSCPNPLNVNKKGVLSIAILGTEDFDVTQIDPVTLVLNVEGEVGAVPLRWSYEDVATPFEGELCDCHELYGDGYVDLSVKFDAQEVVLYLGDVNDGDVLTLTLTGNLKEEFGGTPIKGQDCVVILMK